MSSPQHIRQSMDTLASHFATHPQDALTQDKPATATLVSGLHFRVTGPTGESIATDMPKAIGGKAEAPSPGWFMRAALASCETTVIAMRAAQLGIALTTLEVVVGSQSDSRGLLGEPASVPAGPSRMHVAVRIAADGVPEQALRDLVHWAEAHSPVGSALRRAVPLEVAVQVGPA
ncbi:OsmC-like protein [compost metagenome]|nr:OsmC family protein [Variovorax boronicumulans]MDP9879449.1 putative OsmC-like protein [Variovorax boronicumulans]MDP9918454.1 putative OsmC-like protein [Variovorax boronicumulans]MDP9924874.1 putative OsmC-like protein [Variovorax boronicumulans]GER18031.1 OsmC family peroxiredoxin [Variovorax boronicumulans]